MLVPHKIPKPTDSRCCACSAENERVRTNNICVDYEFNKLTKPFLSINRILANVGAN